VAISNSNGHQSGTDAMGCFHVAPRCRGGCSGTDAAGPVCRPFTPVQSWKLQFKLYMFCPAISLVFAGTCNAGCKISIWASLKQEELFNIGEQI
jgi:hypothetical protein